MTLSLALSDQTNNPSLHNITEGSWRLVTFETFDRTDFWKIFRFLEDFQIFGRFSDFWKMFRFLEEFQIFGRFSGFWTILGLLTFVTLITILTLENLNS